MSITIKENARDAKKNGHAHDDKKDDLSHFALLGDDDFGDDPLQEIVDRNYGHPKPEGLPLDDPSSHRVL
jgi:hypothetical protein